MDIFSAPFFSAEYVANLANMVIWYDDDDMMMMMIDDGDDDEYPWKNCANHTVLRIDLLKVCIVVKTELTLLGGLATDRAVWPKQAPVESTVLSDYILFAQFFSKNSRLFLRIIDALNDEWWLRSERVHDNNIRKVIKHFQKQRVWREHHKIL